MLGADGLLNSTKFAILNANYIKERLHGSYEVLYTGETGRCAHEMILDCRPFKQAHIEVVDIAKRLMDYGYHAPTVSFPVAGTVMVEPTESESKEELDRFIEAMKGIRSEIKGVAEGMLDAEDNVLVNSPHPISEITANDWSHKYSREDAAYPANYLRTGNKFWAVVSRVDNAFGDRNLICTCPPLSAYED